MPDPNAIRLIAQSHPFGVSIREIAHNVACSREKEDIADLEELARVVEAVRLPILRTFAGRRSVTATGQCDYNQNAEEDAHNCSG